MISDRYPKEFAKNENDLRIRIRGLKENLFSYGKLSVYGIEILLSDLSNTNEVKQMISEIREKFELAFKNAGAGIRTWLSSKEGAESRIALAMAGGGAEIDFLVSALTQAINVEGVAHSLDLIKSELRNTYDLNGASYSRMVVALGGVSEIYETVIHEHTKLLAIPSLGYAKQKIS